MTCLQGRRQLYQTCAAVLVSLLRWRSRGKWHSSPGYNRGRVIKQCVCHAWFNQLISYVLLGIMSTLHFTFLTNVPSKIPHVMGYFEKTHVLFRVLTVLPFSLKVCWAKTGKPQHKNMRKFDYN